MSYHVGPEPPDRGYGNQHYDRCMDTSLSGEAMLRHMNLNQLACGAGPKSRPVSGQQNRGPRDETNGTTTTTTTTTTTSTTTSSTTTTTSTTTANYYLMAYALPPTSSHFVSVLPVFCFYLRPSSLLFSLL